MLDLVLGWAALLVLLVAVAIRPPSKGGALTLSYFFGLSVIHVVGLIAFLGSGSGLTDLEVTRIGGEMTVLGMAAFVAGAILARATSRRGARLTAQAPQRRAQAFSRFGWRAFAVGIISYFVLLPLSGSVPSFTAVVSAVATLLILGFWLVLYSNEVVSAQRYTLATLALLPFLPLATLVTGGFLGYGVYWVLSIITFLFVISRRRIWFYLAAPLVVYLGLSLFITYSGQRNGIREVVWLERSSLVDRLVRVSTLVTDFQLLDLNSPTHVAAIDDRLNQNVLVGVAVRRHEAGLSEFAYGGTVAWWALIPRALWPDKPAVGGGGSIVTQYTGIQFAAGTSVGAGQVMEFYVNFGVPGLLIGFAALGFALLRLDYGIMRALAADDTRGLLLRTMPGLALLQPGGNLLEILVALVAAYVGARLILYARIFGLQFSAGAQQARSVSPGSGVVAHT
jgi:hypothetical protein